ncbi:MAG: peptidoglycan glycosyltransferase [Eubacterium sp.]|nr:peptidoglycan glycosyltransferase [Eubacterium sp.]
MIIFFVCIFARLLYLMVFQSEYYGKRALEVQERERKIKAPRGKILDRNGKILASNETVCTISVIYSQMTDKEKVIRVLSEEMEIEEEILRKKVYKKSLREKIKSNVPKEVGDRIRTKELPGVKVDEDYKRYYPYGSLASKVLGFTGGDNQGIIGLEVQYDSYLKGNDGKILTPTDSKGIEQEGALERRVEPVAGGNLVTSLDWNIQKYAQQIADYAREAKEANYVTIIVMDVRNGEIYAMANSPEFDLNHPYELPGYNHRKSGKKYQEMLNKMWRNPCINDTYEPGSTFKVVTATAALEENLVNLKSRFFCPGYKIVDDRRIKCHKITGHGSESFLEGTMNSCNPVFIQVGLEVGTKRFYQYFQKLGLMKKTGIDLPGEASTIIHPIKKVGNVELATMSFGQSFQITPLQYLVAASAIVNGGKLVTPHFAVQAKNDKGQLMEQFSYPEKEKVVSKKTSKTVRYMLEQVVAEGTGSKGKVEGFRVGGKTATSQKLPRGSGKYIASYMGFAPANDPKVIAMAIVDEPKGIYYGGQVAAPLIRTLYENILPYLLEEQK